jgi:short-subunit dehydrogenase
MGAYCASKFAMNAFSYSLRAELKEYDINVLNLIVGRINTGFSSRALGSMKPPDTPFGGNIDKFANIVYKAYEKRKREIVYPYWYKFLIIFGNLFPDLYDKISLKMWERKD